MSLYKCNQLIKEHVKLLNEKYDESSNKVRNFLVLLQQKFKQRIERDDYTDLQSDIDLIYEFITLYFPKGSKSKLCLCFNEIAADLATIKQNLENPSLPSERFKEFKIAELVQGNLYKCGNDTGYCYGFTFSAVNPKTSPFEVQNLSMDLNSQVYKYQQYQGNRRKDQASVKKTRITRKIFCPDPVEQALQILKIAKKREREHLKLGLIQAAELCHSCYLSFDSGKIKFIDSNFGVYLFENEDKFIAFYKAVFNVYKSINIDFSFYELCELKYDELVIRKEKFSWQGKIRTFLTGPKYTETHIDYARPIILGAGFVAGFAVGLLLGAGIGVFLGLMAGITCGSIGGIGAALLYRAANNAGFTGILAIPHFLKNKWHNSKKNKLTEPLLSHSVHNNFMLNSTEKVISLLDNTKPAINTLVAAPPVKKPPQVNNQIQSMRLPSSNRLFLNVDKNSADHNNQAHLSMRL